MLHIRELSEFLKYCAKRNELSLSQEVISIGLGFFWLVSCIAQLKFFEMSTEHCLGQKMSQLFIAEVGPELFSVPFKEFIRWWGKPHHCATLCEYGWEKLNHY